MPRTTDTDGPTWGASGLNERFRGYRYRPGQRFAPHYDGCFARNAEERSAITFLIYLDEGFVGGETRILDWSVTVAPKKGSLFVFDHYVLHVARPSASTSQGAGRGDAGDGGPNYPRRSWRPVRSTCSVRT